jgi:hypothetical protein
LSDEGVEGVEGVEGREERVEGIEERGIGPEEDEKRIGTEKR